jgi:Zn-dependent metalloprotease
VDVDKHGKVYNIQNDLIPLQFLRKADDAVQAKRARNAASPRRAGAEAELTADEAIERAFEATGDKSESSRRAEMPEYVYFPHDGIPTPAWKVTVENTSSRAGEWKVYVDAVSGDVLESIDLIKRQSGHGQVFDPNLVVALNGDVPTMHF